MLLLRTWRPLQFDFHGLGYPEGSEIERHMDPMSVGRHDRFAIVGKESAGGSSAGQHIAASSDFVWMPAKAALPSDVLQAARASLRLGAARQLPGYSGIRAASGRPLL